MDALVSIVGSIFGSLAGTAAEYAVDPIAKQLSYLFKHKTKFRNLKSKVEELKDAGQRIQQSVHEANRNGEEIFDDVQKWLTDVNEKISEQATTQLQEDEDKAMKRCLAGFCPDFKSRYQLSKKAETEANAIAQLLNQKNNLYERVSYRPALEGISTIRSVKEYEAFESRSGAFKGVMEALEDESVSIIGVYGMGGVGKTTLVKEVAGKAKEKLSFDEVIFVAVTQTPNTLTIQHEIANKLGLKLDNDPSIDVRAVRLCHRLKKINKVLIILDDIWEELDLDALGIPSTDQHKGCKILMTSRKVVILKSMCSQKNFSINILKDDEAWNLFKNVAGHTVERSDLQSAAKKVAQKCAGLPIAITTVAKALKHKENLFEWEDALEQLRPSEINIKGISGAVYSAIETSYKYLEAEELKSTFLICSTMGHDAPMEDLVKQCRGLGLFRGLDTIAKVRNRVLTLVSELKDSSLLLAGSTSECFDIHDIVRDVAISIASRDRGWLALGKEDIFEEWLDEDRMRNCNLISLQYAKVSELPDGLEYPNLNLFSMHGKESSLEIPNNFLKGMKRLKVLTFTKMKFSSLASSIGFLKTLCTLRLIECDVKDIVIVGELDNLEVLDLRGSKIVVLPEKIGQLKRLKLLDLSDCRELKVISPGVLSSLTKLEELYLYDSFDKWEVEGRIENNERRHASLVELQNLYCLTTLELHIPDEQAIPEDNLFFGKLERFKISIGDGSMWDWWSDSVMKTSRMLKMKTSINMYDEIKMMLRKVESLYIDGVEDVEKMFYDPITKGLPHLKHLTVFNVSDIKVVINSMMLVSCLESLSLGNLTNLEAICDHRQLRAESFGRLKVLKVHNCKMLKNLFSFSIANGLCRQLEELVVFGCVNMKELILVEKEDIFENDDILEFTQLSSLMLGSLHNFNGLWSSEITLQSAACLFDQKILFPAMEELELLKISGIEKLWHDDHLPPLMSFGVQSLTILKVSQCHKLKYVFTSSMVKNFVQLKTLDVCDCDEMEDVIEGILGGEEMISNSIVSVLPKLDSLKLEGLPKLKRFGCGSSLVEFPSLRRLDIEKCPVLRAFYCDSTSIAGKNIDTSLNPKLRMNNIPRPQYLFNEKVILLKLEELRIVDILNLERLWANQLADQHSFSKLTLIYLIDCPKLLNVFPMSMLPRLQKIKTLTVWGCESVEEIILESEFQFKEEGSSSAMQSQVIQSNFITTVEFPCLTSLRLYQLPNLKRMYSKMLTINWAAMEEMVVGGCEKVEILFGCEETLISGKSSSEDVGLIPIHPLFWVNQFTFPKLNKLTLERNAGMKEIWHCNGHGQQCPKFWILRVSQCSKLRSNLVPSSVSFRNLVTLTVSGCDGIIKLITHSTAKSLVQLEQMIIWGCQNIEEIIQGSGDDKGDDDEISFPKLSSLSLHDLPKLESFSSSGNYTFGFPSLEKVAVVYCRKMKMFSQRDSSTPILHKVLLDVWEKNEERWEGSLNSTIQQLFREENNMIDNSAISEEDESKPSTSNAQAILDSF